MSVREPDDAAWVRRAHPADAGAIGSLQVRAWRRAYAGLMPQDYLEGLDVGERTAFWRTAIGGPPPGSFILVVCRGAAVVGFAVGGPDEGEPGVAAGPGRLYALDVDPSVWGSGAGSAALLAAQERLAAAGFSEAVLWVLAGNQRARGWCERHGWGPDDAERPARIEGADLLELRYRRALR